MQAEKQKERIKSKKDQISEITKLRKQRAAGGFQGELDFDKSAAGQKKMTPDKAGQRIRKGVQCTLFSFVHPVLICAPCSHLCTLLTFLQPVLL